MRSSPMKHFAMIVATSLLVVAGVTPASAASAYEMAVAPAAPGVGPSYFRINVASGQVVTVGTAMAPMTDSAPLPQGEYHLYLAGDARSYWLYRMDSQSGRIWFISNNS